MDTQQLNTYLHLIEALLDCAKGEEWLLLQQHEDLIDAKLLTVMAQITDRLNTEGNAPAAKFLHYWTVQLTHLLQQNTSEDSAQSRADSYLKLIQTLLGCSKGDEVAILNQHPDLVDEGLVYTMNQVAAQLAAKGSQDTAIYLKHLAAEVNRVGQHPGAGANPNIGSTTQQRYRYPAQYQNSDSKQSAPQWRSTISNSKFNPKIVAATQQSRCPDRSRSGNNN